MATSQELDHQTFEDKKFNFEGKIYLHLWGILVGITVITNALAVYVFMQRSLRSLTNLLLFAIAISDLLAGLMTFPTYILVYTSREPPTYGYNDKTETLNNDYTFTYMYYAGDCTLRDIPWDTIFKLNTNDTMVEVKRVYVLDKVLCDVFMISTSYLNKVFHTISIWLTLYLGIQRYISVRYPIISRFLLTTRRKVIGCAIIIFAALVLHLYHLFNYKKVNGYCTWMIEKDCSETFVQFWITLLLRHLLPCFALTVITVLFVRHLVCSTQIVNKSRVEENRRSSKIVIGTVIVFFITEVPYGLFLLYSAIIQHSKLEALSLQANIAFHVTYDIFTLLSSNANFCIYVIFHQRFRAKLREKLCCKDKCTGHFCFSTFSTKTDGAVSQTAADVELRPLS